MPEIAHLVTNDRRGLVISPTHCASAPGMSGHMRGIMTELWGVGNVKYIA